jgi:predicted amidohydrolase YtcJ
MSDTTSPANEPISLAVVNARVLTGDSRRPWADAVAVRGDRIAAVGSSAEVRKMCVATTRVVDANAQMLIPGVHEADARFTRESWDGRATQNAPRIERGALADFTLVDRDLTRAGAASIGDARVMLTVAGGRVTFER